MVDRVVQVVRHPGGRVSVLRGTQEQILAALVGPPGPPGPPGPSGIGYTHEQRTPASSWPIAHNLGRLPSVTVVVNGQHVLTDVEYSDLNNALVVWSEPTSGTAYVS